MPGVSRTKLTSGTAYRTRERATVITWVVNGREATDRAGAAEYTGLSRGTVAVYAGPANRERFGWPEPLPERPDGTEVFALEDLQKFREPAGSGRPRRGRPLPSGLPDDLIGCREFGDLHGVSYKVIRQQVRRSQSSWDLGLPGSLPIPDQTRPVQWLRSTAQAWQPSSADWLARDPGPTVDDLRQLLDEHPANARPTPRSLAAELTERFGRNVDPATVRRLLGQLHDRLGQT